MSLKSVSDLAEPAPPLDLAAARRERLGAIVETRRAVRLEELSTALGRLPGHGPPGPQRAGGGRPPPPRPRRRRRGGRAAGRAPVRRQGLAAAAQKARIAARAVELLAPDDTVYLDSGSTVLARRPAPPRLGPPHGRDQQPPGGQRAARARAAPDPRGRRAPGAEPGRGRAADPPAARGHPRGPCPDGHLRPVPRGRADDHRPRRGIHEGAGARDAPAR